MRDRVLLSAVTLSTLALAALCVGGVAASQAQTQNSRPSLANLRVPLGYTREQVLHGEKVFHGEAAGGKCSECHGADAKGTANGNDLTSGLFGWSDGSVRGLKASVQHNMKIAPGMDGNLKPDDVDAVVAYVWAISRPNLCPTEPPKPGEWVRTDCPLP